MTADDDSVGPVHHVMNGLLASVQQLDQLVYGADLSTHDELLQQLEEVETFATNMRRALGEALASQR